MREPYIGMPIYMGGHPNHSVSPPTHGTNPMPYPPNTGGFDARPLGTLPIAMAYVPMQQWKDTYPPSEALTRGTLFPELDLPFEGYRTRGGGM